MLDSMRPLAKLENTRKVPIFEIRIQVNAIQETFLILPAPIYNLSSVHTHAGWSRILADFRKLNACIKIPIAANE